MIHYSKSPTSGYDNHADSNQVVCAYIDASVLLSTTSQNDVMSWFSLLYLSFNPLLHQTSSVVVGRGWKYILHVLNTAIGV